MRAPWRPCSCSRVAPRSARRVSTTGPTTTTTTGAAAAAAAADSGGHAHSHTHSHANANANAHGSATGHPPLGHHQHHFYDRSIEEYAGRLPMAQRIDYAFQLGANPSAAQLISSAEHLRVELPVRFAHTIRNFQNLPYIVGINPHVHAVYNRYLQGFHALRVAPKVTDEASEREFLQFLQRMLDVNRDTVTRLSIGIREVRQLPASLGIDYKYIDEFIDKFLVQRISRRVIAEFHMGLHVKRDGWVGAFNLKTSPRQIIEATGRRARALCEDVYGHAPKLEIVGDVDHVLPYIEVHLEYMLLEILKNSMRAVAEVNQGTSGGGGGGGIRRHLPPVVVRICAGQDTHIIVSDQGGGIPEEMARDVWSYGFTCREKVRKAEEQEAPGFWQDFRRHQTPISTELAGYGFGLPSCRVYARYLDGDLQLHNMPGFGADVRLTLIPLDKKGLREKLLL